MSNSLNHLKPEIIWSIFSDLCNIPRPSKKEEKVIQYVKNFGEQLGLETFVDVAGNVIIKKPATRGMENRMGVVLQSHLDMVPQKNSETSHDFEKDPIQAYVDGDWVTAKDTTLGADNGIGVSAILAILRSHNLKHGPIEALFTIDEETGMTGAFALEPGMLNGKILINLDSEEEGELYVGCAGGLDANIEFNYPLIAPENNMLGFEIIIKGLKGGHSGLDINLGRGNSNKLLARILWNLVKSFNAEMSSFNGGNLRNAIPRESFAKIAIDKKSEAAVIDYMTKIKSVIINELSAVEPNLEILWKVTELPAQIANKESSLNILKALYACPNGVIRMSDSMPGMVETSSNMAIVKMAEGNAVVHCLLRSAVDSAKQELAERIQSVFELAVARVSFSGEYPGWKPNMSSPILKTMQEVYQQNYGKKSAIQSIHAGLECGIIGASYPQMDMISFGPTIKYPHSPDEKVHIGSVGKFWDYLIKTLENIPTK
ncbi:MAG: aminoacyl-histidine dipeptidase [Bacteroidales bacterium]|nr:aminoacyl-histidine dipeptidase [Bacteroidales bacterium]